jgi:hypothetical protein
MVCAWCCRDGESGYMGEREPLDNPEPTHGICPRHTAQLLESLPSRSFPDAELLIVVRRDDPALYESLKRSLAGVAGVKVIVDRRISDRRAAPSPGYDERRSRGTRRIRSAASSHGDLTIVRFTPKSAITPPR